MYYYNGFFPLHIIGSIIVVIFWVFIIVFIVHALRGRHPFVKYTPLDLLKERYAKGEITKEQFDQMKKDIQ